MSTRIWTFICQASRRMVDGLKKWRQRRALGRAEVERLDRIRNPSNYLGK